MAGDRISELEERVSRLEQGGRGAERDRQDRLAKLEARITDLEQDAGPDPKPAGPAPK